MKRTVYEAPVTELFQVELEGNFCASAEIENGDHENAGIGEHEVNNNFGGDFSESGWDTTIGD